MSQVCVNSILSTSYVFTGLISAKLFYAIRTVETGGDANAVSKDGKSLGAYQITEPYWNAAVQRDSSLSAKGQKWDNCKGDLSYSEKVMQVTV